MKKCILFFALVFVWAGTVDAQTRLLNKIKDKAEDKIVDQLFNEKNNNLSNFVPKQVHLL